MSRKLLLIALLCACGGGGGEAKTLPPVSLNLTGTWVGQVYLGLEPGKRPIMDIEVEVQQVADVDILLGTIRSNTGVYGEFTANPLFAFQWDFILNQDTPCREDYFGQISLTPEGYILGAYTGPGCGATVQNSFLIQKVR